MAASLSMPPRRNLLSLIAQYRAVSAVQGSHRLLHSVSSQLEQRAANAVQEEQSEIVIPRRKKRDSLTVLRALASTVKVDSKAPHYKYVDDPYLIPATTLAKKSYALSKESGKKAARYVLENYSQFFNTNPAEPPVKAFMPPKSAAYVHTEPNEKALLERIEKRRVKDAIDVYKKMQQEKTNVSEDARLRLLELVCVYNEDDPPLNMMQEEFFFRKTLGVEVKRPSKSWKDNGLAERIFDDLKEKIPQAYQDLIRGMSRYLQTEKAFQLYDEMVEKKMPVDLLTYNALISIVTFYKDTHDTKWQQIETLLMDMQLNGVRPNLSTFNAVLFSLSRMTMYRQTPSLALQTLVEMRNVGIEPSLASWKCLLSIFYPNESSDSNMLYKIMDELEGKQFELRHADDVEFFVSAMKVACQNLHDIELSFRIEKLVNLGSNALLLGDSRLINIFYSFFLRQVFLFEAMDTSMEVYQRVTPHLWTPNLSVMEELLKAVELQDGYKYLPLIWTDFLLFEFLRREDLLEKLLQLMAKQKQEVDLQAQYTHVAKQLVQRWSEEQEEGRDPILSTAPMVGHVLTMAENGGDHDLAWTMFDLYSKNKHAFTGIPAESALQQLVGECLDHAEGDRAVTVVNFMNSLEMSGVGSLARKVLESEKVELSEQQREMMARL